MGLLSTMDESNVENALQSVKELKGRLSSLEECRPLWRVKGERLGAMSKRRSLERCSGVVFLGVVDVSFFGAASTLRPISRVAYGWRGSAR
jgi:hypothetical protein